MPNDFKKQLNEMKLQDKKENEEEAKEERLNKQAFETHVKREARLYPDKVEMCRKIFLWKDEFLQTEEGKGLFKRGESIWVTSGRWGHEFPEDNTFGCWSRIYIDKRGIEYKSGYRSMGFMQCYQFTTPEEMAKKLGHLYLKSICEKIDKKVIFEDIIKFNSN